MTNVIQNLGTGVKTQTIDGLDPRATRYAFNPIWPVTGVVSNAFQTGTLPRGILSFNTFPFPLTNDAGRQVERVRTPAEQIQDFLTITADKAGVVLDELANLQDPALAEQICAILVPAEKCEKYPFELDNTCATCWLAHLQGNDVAVGLAGIEKRGQDAAVATARKLINALNASLDKARQDINVAKQHVEDPKKGKDSFAPVDLLNIRHCHQDMPEYRTVTSAQSGSREIADAIREGLRGGITADDVKSMIADAVVGVSAAKDAEIERLTAELAAIKAPKKGNTPKEGESAPTS